MNEEKIREWSNRKLNASHLSMRKLGEVSGIDFTKISRVLSGKQSGDFGFYLELARAFDAVPEFLRVADILPDEDQPGALFADIWAAVKELTIEERQEVLRYALFVKQGRDTQSEPREADAQTWAKR